MATVALTASPTQLDAGTTYDLVVVNSGSSTVHVQVDSGNNFDQRLSPGQSVVVYPHGLAVTAYARSGSGQVTVTTQTNPQSPSGGSSLASRQVSSPAYAATITPAVSTTGGDVVLNVGTLTGNVTFANPTGTPVDAQHLTLRLAQDATGSRTYTFGTAYAFGTDITAALLPSAANATFELIFQYNLAATKWRAVGLVRGF